MNKPGFELRSASAGIRLSVVTVCLFVINLTFLARGLAEGLPQAPGEYDNLEAVIETSRGQIVIEFLPSDAPRHVEYFVKKAREGAYDGTAFHRAVEYALIQGGDPLSKNPRARAQYGTGGLGVGLPDEVNKHKHITGAVSSVLQIDRANPNEVKAGSSGAQFFIVLNAGTAQSRLDSKFTVFARVVEGLDVVSNISASPANKTTGLVNDRIEITKITVREKTPTAEQIKAMTAVIETSLGNMKLQFLPDAPPSAARQFIRYIKSGMYDGVAFHRVSQKYYLEAGSLESWPADSANRKRFFSLWPIAMEKNQTSQVRGMLSLSQVPEGMTSHYFFIISQDNPALDGKAVPVARVVEGLEVLDKIAAAEVEGNKPKERIEIKKIAIQ
jgi:cyclophilin family peptidyl-prolyl cis-trans isomerase